MTKEKYFAEDELRAISQALGATDDGLTNAEIDDLLHYCRVPDEHGPGTKWQRIFYNLWNHQVRVKNRTNALEFIRQAMKPARHIRNPQRFDAMRASLNLALSFAGLEVDKSGAIQSVTRARTLDEANARAEALRGDMSERGVHSDVLKFCRAELLAEDYFHAVQEAAKSIFDKIRVLSGRTEDGGQLVDVALGGNEPILAINTLSTESERSEQKGFTNLIKGTYGMFRNPTAHEARIKWTMTKEDAEDLLSLASLIHRRLDSAMKR